MKLGKIIFLFISLKLGSFSLVTYSLPSDGQDTASVLARKPSQDAHYLDIPTHKLLGILKDPQNRVNPLFQVPASIKSEVGFWFQIYAKYSLYQTLLYDRDNPQLIYEVIDNRDFFQQGLSAAAIEVKSKQRIQKVITDYKNAFQKLKQNQNTVFPKDSAGYHITHFWGKKSSKKWKEIEDNFRTQPGQRDRIMQGLVAADPFLPAMESIFKKFSLPIEITRLPLVESSFNLRAYSKADAVGVWQFLKPSAEEYLIVDEKNSIDERLSPIKSTYAAAKMFQRNYKLLKDYGLSIIAYNHGAKNLVSLKEKYAGKNIAWLIKKQESPLGYASRNFYCEFLALLHAERYRQEIYSMESPNKIGSISIVKVKKSLSIFEISSQYNISIHELRLFNPDIFDYKKKLPIGTRVVIPKKVEGSIVLSPVQEKTRDIASDLEFIEEIR